jgi:hypothetical protein
MIGICLWRSVGLLEEIKAANFPQVSLDGLRSGTIPEELSVPK